MVRNMGIPKRIGAVKVSKKVRKRVKRAIKSAANPFVRDFATAAMAAAGRVRREAKGSNEGKAHIMCGETRIHVDGSKVAEAFRAAAINGLRTFLEGLEEGLREARTDPQPEPRAKPKPKAKAKPAAKPKARKARSSAAKPRSRAPGA